jgi:predicted acylesterase/phospholipase RssA
MDLLAEAERVRFVVDVISGTSAGGINGAFLAKALANGQEFSPLKKLWIQEGDIDGLLNDDASYKGLEYARNDAPPRSLLNSDRMYLKLLDAFANMKTAIPPVSPTESALADEIDLYMTTTDIRGTVVPLRLFMKSHTKSGSGRSITFSTGRQATTSPMTTPRFSRSPRAAPHPFRSPSNR